MRTAHDIILAPIITENSMDGLALRKYTFKVAKDANKIEIAKAVEELFSGTEVSAVNTMNCRGHLKKMGRNEGYTPAFKKAIVTLTAKSKGIEFFESMQ
ncbi:MAG: 50S ribosomal protein L23 [Angelakisella sp.]